MLLLYPVALWLFFRKHSTKTSYLPLFFIIYSLITSVSISVTRFSYAFDYPYYSMASRFSLDTHYGVIGVVWILIKTYWHNISFINKRLFYQKYLWLVLILCFIILGQVWTNIEEWHVGYYRKKYFENLIRIALSGDYSNKKEIALFQVYDQQWIIKGLNFLKQHKLNVFSE